MKLSSKTLSRATVILSFALVALFGTFAHAETPVKVKFTLDWKFEGQTSFMWLGLQRGYFKQEGLDVQIDAGVGSAGTVQRIHSGAYDMGLGDMTTVIEYASKFSEDRRLQMVYLQYDDAPIAYYSLKKNGAKTIADLAGKSIVVSVDNIAKKLWPIVAHAAKIDANSVTWVTTAVPLRTNVVIQGGAFACGGFLTEPLDFETRGVKREDLVELRAADVGVRLYGNGLLVSSKFINEHPKAVHGFVRALNRSFREALADPVAAIKALKVQEPLADERVNLERFELLFPTILTPRTRADGLGGIDKAVLQEQINDTVKVLDLKNKPNADQIFNPNFLPPKLERMPLK